MSERAKQKRLLGIALGERGLLVAEVSCAGRESRATAAEFAYPAGMSLEQPEALGRALGEFLRQRNIGARRAVFGVPAKWLICKSHTLPPADAETAASMLRLHGETATPPELGEVVFDYAGQCHEGAQSCVLLVGLAKRWVERVKALAGAAGLRALSVTPAVTSLGGDNGDALALALRPEGAEMLARVGGATRWVRHLGSGTSGGALLTEVRRAAAVVPAALLNGDGAGGSSRRLVVWDETGADDEALSGIGEAIGLPAVRGDVRSLAVLDPASARGASKATPVALAAPLVAGRRPEIDFLHPRIAPPKVQHRSRRTGLIAAGAAAVVLVGALMYADLAKIERQVTSADEEIKRLDPAYKLARPFVNDMQFAEAFQGKRSIYLTCLADATAALPADGQTYLTSFNLHANMKGEFIGRSANAQDILGLLDKLNTGGRFTELKRRLDARGTGPETTFFVTFTYVPSRP